MKKRILNGFKNYYDYIIMVIWWIIIMIGIIWIPLTGSLKWIKLCSFILLIGYIAYGIKMVKQQRYEEKLKMERLQNKYVEYIGIVSEELQKISDRIDQKTIDFFGISFVRTNDYLISFERYLNWVCQNRIGGEPNSFIVATCLMNSLLEHHRIVLKQKKTIHDEIKSVESDINLEIAMNCVLRIISTPITYTQNQTEEKLNKVDITFLKKMIKNNKFNREIRKAIIQDHSNETIVHIAHILYFIYLECQ